MTNIIVCFYRPEDGELIKNIIGHAGYRVASLCCSGAKALEACMELGSGIIVSSYRMLDMVCLDLFESKPDSFEMITVSSPKNWQAFLPPCGLKTTDIPLNTRELIKKIEEAETLIKKLHAKKDNSKNRSEADILLINSAKEKCIKEFHMDEPTAHKYIQNMAMNNGISFVEAAKEVLAG